MMTYILTLTILCSDGFSTSITYNYEYSNELENHLVALEENNRHYISDHKKCYEAEAEWYSEEKREGQEESHAE